MSTASDSQSAPSESHRPLLASNSSDSPLLCPAITHSGQIAFLPASAENPATEAAAEGQNNDSDVAEEKTDEQNGAESLEGQNGKEDTDRSADGVGSSGTPLDGAQEGNPSSDDDGNSEDEHPDENSFAAHVARNLGSGLSIVVSTTSLLPLAVGPSGAPLFVRGRPITPGVGEGEAEDHGNGRDGAASEGDDDKEGSQRSSRDAISLAAEGSPLFGASSSSGVPLTRHNDE